MKYFKFAGMRYLGYLFGVLYVLIPIAAMVVSFAYSEKDGFGLVIITFMLCIVWYVAVPKLLDKFEKKFL